MTNNQIGLNPSAVARALGVLAFLLVVASTVGQLTKYLTGHDQVYGLVRLFNVFDERNIPTLFSVLLLAWAALLLAVIAVLKHAEKDQDALKWWVLSLGFLLMAVDEAWAIHDKLVAPVRGLLGGGTLGIFYFAWVIPGMAMVLALALYLAQFMLRLPARTRLLVIVAGALYVGGAIGLELIGGRYAELNGEENLTYSMLATLEEALEMAGVIVFIYALLSYIATHYGHVQFRLDDVGKRSRSPATHSRDGH